MITAWVFLLGAGLFFLDIKALEIVAFLCVLAGFCFLLWLFKRPHAHAANCRLAAELGRSLLAVWNIPGAAPRIFRAPPRAFDHLVRSLLLHRRIDPARRRAAPGELLGEAAVKEMADQYLTGRVRPQLLHYSDRRQRAKRVGLALEILGGCSSLIAVISAGVLAFHHSFPATIAHALESQLRLWGLAKLFAATLAPVAVSLLVIHEIKRRETRYHEMEHSLEELARKIGHARSFATFRELVIDAERLLLSETYEWWVLAKENVAA